MSCEPFFLCHYSYVVHTEYIFTCIWHVFHQLDSAHDDNLPERVQILGHAHILCITLRENRIICCQIFCDLLLKSAFELIFNVMQLILVKINDVLSENIQSKNSMIFAFYITLRYNHWRNNISMNDKYLNKSHFLPMKHYLMVRLLRP